MTYITRIKLTNFKRFRTLNIQLQNGRNILVGKNASGKSSILQAIEFCLLANRRNVEEENLKFLINTQVVSEFSNLPKEERALENLPIVEVEIFLDECENPDFVGANNSENTQSPGIKLRIFPDTSLGNDINTIISNDEFSFPFEFYVASFTSFQGGAYSKFSCPIDFLLVDHSSIGAVSATNNYIRRLFSGTTSAEEKNKIAHSLRGVKEKFNNDTLKSLTSSDTENFVLRTDKHHAISQSVSIETNGVDIMHEGKGGQSLIKTKFALERRSENTDVLLIEEPENHLSHSSMHALLGLFDESHEGQTIISTHSSLIASGLRLNNLLIVGSDNEINFSLQNLDVSTADFFSKAPDHLLLEFVLSNKVLLVEGSAEYILFPLLYSRLYAGQTMDHDGIHLISVGGIKFKRYLAVAALLQKQTAFIQDNDGKSVHEVQNQYLRDDDDRTSMIVEDLHYLGVHDDPEEATLEEVLYASNYELLESLFSGRVRTNTVQAYMLANKTKVALELASYLSSNPDAPFVIPNYIQDSFEWLRD